MKCASPDKKRTAEETVDPDEPDAIETDEEETEEEVNN